VTSAPGERDIPLRRNARGCNESLCDADEQAVRESREWLGVMSTCVATDPHGGVTWWNPVAYVSAGRGEEKAGRGLRPEEED